MTRPECPRCPKGFVWTDKRLGELLCWNCGWTLYLFGAPAPAWEPDRKSRP